MNNKRANGKRKRIERYKMKKLQGKTRIVEIAVKEDVGYSEPLLIKGLKSFENFK